MKTINLTHPSPELADLFTQARNDDPVVKLADGREFLLMAVYDFDREIAPSRNNPKLTAFLEARVSQTKTVPLDEVRRQLKL